MLFFGWIVKFVKKYRTRGGFNGHVKPLRPMVSSLGKTVQKSVELSKMV